MTRKYNIFSVPDLDPNPDPHVLGPPGSGSGLIIQSMDLDLAPNPDPDPSIIMQK
jgi:hypothetical protein